MLPIVGTEKTGGTMFSPAPVGILWGGLIAGVLDGLDALLFFSLVMGAAPGRIFQFIASGLLGPKAFESGGSALLGVVCHFIVAFGAATAYYLLSRMVPSLLARPFLWGPLFGVGVYAFMQYVVIPLSLVPRRVAPTSIGLLNQLFAHTVLVGLPIALAARWSARKP
jgi:hypothetical protein